MLDRPITIKLEPREGGGLRVYSDDLPGLVLSHSDQRAVLMDIGPAIIGILEHKRDVPDA